MSSRTREIPLSITDSCQATSTTLLLPVRSKRAAAHPDDPIQSAIIEKPANHHSQASCHDPHGLVLIRAGSQGGQIPATRFYHFLASDVRCKSWFAHHTKVEYQDFEAIFLDHLLRMGL